MVTVNRDVLTDAYFVPADIPDNTESVEVPLGHEVISLIEHSSETSNHRKQLCYHLDNSKKFDR